MYKKIEEIITEKRNPYFSITVEEGNYTCGNQESYYRDRFPDDTFSYDISNNKVLANLDEFGTVKLITFYRENYICDNIPGVWVAKDFSQEGPFSFQIVLEGEVLELTKGIMNTKSDLLDNLFPRFQYVHSRFSATVLAYAPISEDGTQRLRGLIYGLFIQNEADALLEGEVIPPTFSGDQEYFKTVDASGVLLYHTLKNERLSFALPTKASIWIPMVIYGPGETKDVDIIREKGTLYWFNQTHAYYRKILGRLTMAEDPLTAAIFERSVYQGISAVGMSRDGNVCGSNWGTFPTTQEIWMKDMYYSYLPLVRLEPEFFKKGCLWFLKYGIRPKGSKYIGGVYHSLSNSLSSVMMVSLYYEATGDSHFFAEYPNVYPTLQSILKEVLELRDEKDGVWLFQTVWISDALALGKYHTGSNVCAWKAFRGMSRIAKEVYDDHVMQSEYEKIADCIRQDIEKYMTVEGAFGRQYLEGIGGIGEAEKKVYGIANYKKKFIDQAEVFLSDVIEGDQINLLMHDGEESDTTLMPFYGYHKYDNEIYRNYLKFTMSTENPTYGTKCRGIRWGNESGATFPGYSTGFAAVTDAETMNGVHGYMRELKRLNDLDGSWWWWPYKCNAETGNVVRLNCCGKCGWAAGVFAALFISQILGIQYDAPKQHLIFRAFSPCSSFSWDNARNGSGLFDFGYRVIMEGDHKMVSVKNRNAHIVSAELEIITDNLPTFRDTEQDYSYEIGNFLNMRTVKIFIQLKPDVRYEILV